MAYDWYNVRVPHDYSLGVEEQRWACDVASHDCKQTVVFDASDVTVWENAPQTEGDCYATLPDCSRWTCDPNTPFGCAKYSSSMNDASGSMPTNLYTEKTCGHVACVSPKYSCVKGTCVVTEDGDYDNIADCKDGNAPQGKVACRLYNLNTSSNEAFCEKTKQYGMSGLSEEDCLKMQNVTRWQCVGAQECRQIVQYKSSGYENAPETKADCEKKCTSVKYKCNDATNTCVQDDAGEFDSLPSCGNSGCGHWGCGSEGTCVKMKYEEGGLYGSSATCKTATACGTKFYCAPGNVCAIAGTSYEGTSYDTRTDCQHACSSSGYVCDPISGICAYNPAVGNLTFADCTAGKGGVAACAQSTYKCDDTTKLCSVDATGGGKSAYDCLNECGFIEPTTDVILDVPGELFDVTGGVFSSKYVGKAFNLATGAQYPGAILGASAVPVNDLVYAVNHGYGIASFSVFTSDLMAYSLDPATQYGILGRRLFSNESTTNTTTTITEYQEAVSINTSVSFGMNLGLFSCTAQINVDLGTAVNESSKVQASTISISVTDGVIDMNLPLVESWDAFSSGSDGFQTAVLSVKSDADVDNFVEKFGTHVCSRIFVGKRFLSAVNNTNSQTISTQSLSVAVCAKASYASSFSASVCNTTKTANSTEVAQAESTSVASVRGGHGLSDQLSPDPAQAAMDFLQWENSSPYYSTAMNYKYLFLPTLIKNAGRKIKDVTLQYQVLNAAAVLAHNLSVGAGMVNECWKKHREGELLAYQHNLWPTWYRGHERVVAEHSGRRVRGGVRATWYQCLGTNPPQCTESASGMSLTMCEKQGGAGKTACAPPTPPNADGYSCDKTWGVCIEGNDYSDLPMCQQYCSPATKMYGCNASTNACEEQAGGQYASPTCNGACVPKTGKYQCQGNVCVESVSGDSYTQCMGECGKNYSCSIPGQMCVEDTFGAFTDQNTCNLDCQKFRPLPSICPNGASCFGVGYLFVVANNDLVQPDKPRPFFNQLAGVLDLDSMNPNGCVTGLYIPSADTMTSSQTSTSTSDILDTFSNSTQVSASYSGGINNASASASIDVGRSTANNSKLSANTIFSYNHVANYKLKDMPACYQLSTIDPDFLNSLLSLPPVWTSWTLPAVPVDAPDFLGTQLQEAYDFANGYGTHVITHVNLGTLLSTTQSASDNSTETTNTLAVNACVGGSGLSWNANACSNNTNTSTNYDENLVANATRKVIGGDGVIRSIIIDPNSPNTAGPIQMLQKTNPAYMQPVSGIKESAGPAYVYESAWDLLYLMYTKSSTQERLDNGVLWTQVLTKATELCLAYYSRWCITDMRIQHDQPSPTQGSDGASGTWVQVINFQCGQPPWINYTPTPSVATGLAYNNWAQSAVNVMGMAYEPPANTLKGDYQYMWVKWELVCMPISTKSIFTHYTYNGDNATPPKGSFKRFNPSGAWTFNFGDKQPTFINSIYFNVYVDSATLVFNHQNTYGFPGQYMSSASLIYSDRGSNTFTDISTTGGVAADFQCVGPDGNGVRYRDNAITNLPFFLQNNGGSNSWGGYMAFYPGYTQIPTAYSDEFTTYMTNIQNKFPPPNPSILETKFKEFIIDITEVWERLGGPQRYQGMEVHLSKDASNWTAYVNDSYSAMPVTWFGELVLQFTVHNMISPIQNTTTSTTFAYINGAFIAVSFNIVPDDPTSSFSLLSRPLNIECPMQM